ncbi:hypothetical protein BKA61DRAFT_246462 [Leptodontidium sp. MPI-SDFR-AT-0119]|nr:hypothetical protein BKA61DRAFT_246462 [Leptodontidium sp. MPI-SDFR-AT-0119]
MITLPLFPLLLYTLSQIEFYMLFYHGSNSNCLETNLNTAQNQLTLVVIDSTHVIRYIPHLRIKSSLCNTSIKSNQLQWKPIGWRIGAEAGAEAMEAMEATEAVEPGVEEVGEVEKQQGTTGTY